MRRVLFILAACSSIILFSCQKEADFPDGTGGGNGNGNGNGGNTDGDLLVKIVETTPATNDSSLVTLNWDASKRLITYKSAGVLNGINEGILYAITRLPDGKIQKIKSVIDVTAGFLDSVIYSVHYVAGTSKLEYSIATQYSFIGELIDSSVYTYNTAGYVSGQQTYSSFFGIVSPSAREEYIYDNNGNLITENVYTDDGTGTEVLSSVSTYTYNAHKNAYVLGEESYIALGAVNVSKNYISKFEIAYPANPAQNLLTNYLQQQFNSFDRPTFTLLSINPQPPGFDTRVSLYYQ